MRLSARVTLTLASFRSTCQVGYVQYIHTFTLGALLSSPWLLLTHQTVWESQSDTNYAERVGNLLANATHHWLAVTPVHLICSSGLCQWVCVCVNELEYEGYIKSCGFLWMARTDITIQQVYIYIIFSDNTTGSFCSQPVDRTI